MQITWLGQACFKIQTKEVIIIIDPYEDKIGFKMPSLKADILLSTHNHYDHNNLKRISGKPFIINGSGEYEVKNVFIYGVRAFHDKEEGKKRGEVTMYLLKLENMTVAHLSDIGQNSLTESQQEVIEDADILMLPVGGVYTVNAKEAVGLVNQIEPKIVIPMHYKISKLKEPLEPVDKFLKEIGVKNGQTEEKLKISKKDLPSEETKVIVLEKQS